MQRAGLKLMGESENEADKKPYVSERTIELDAHRVRLQVWSFDIAVNCKVTRKSFYDSTGVVIIVYSTSDRWSFDSVEFWLKESMAASGQRPPIVIVGNKTDLRSGALLTSREPPVPQEEGLKLAEDVAIRLGSAQKLHPVAFIESSCLTGQGVDDVFRTTAELYVRAASR
jgi:Ras-related protein Rab-23